MSVIVDGVFVNCDTLWTSRQIPAFERNILSPSSMLKWWYLPMSPHKFKTHKDINIFTAMRTSNFLMYLNPNMEN
jgi:hypothetical protein